MIVIIKKYKRKDVVEYMNEYVIDKYDIYF